MCHPERSAKRVVEGRLSERSESKPSGFFILHRENAIYGRYTRTVTNSATRDRLPPCDSGPYVIDPQNPRFPTWTHVSGGAVVVRVLVSLDATGKPVSGEVQQPSGNAALDNAAMKAALASTFAPKLEPVRRQSDGAIAPATPLPDGVVCGVPVPSAYLFQVTFDPY